jgi:uncharacterized membrane protein
MKMTEVKKKDPIVVLQDRMDAIEMRVRNIERDIQTNENSHKRDIEQIKKLLDIWTSRGERKKR